MKRDFMKELENLYKQPKKEISILEVPAMNFLTIRGHGSPNDNPDYSDAVGALYSLAYNLKFRIKKGPTDIDYKVMPLEGLWWAENMNEFNLDDRSNWRWQMMIMQPELITQDLFMQALDEVRTKKNPPRLDEVKFESYDEGLCAQIFHLGPYGEGERENIDRLHQYIHDQGYTLRGKHHEIYFNSPLRTAPEKLKTIIRQPIQKAV